MRLMPADATVLSSCAAERAAVMAEEICTFGHPLSQLLGCSARRAAVMDDATFSTMMSKLRAAMAAR